jgi:hypothetical protein
MAAVVTRAWFSVIAIAARLCDDTDIPVSTPTHEHRRGPDTTRRTGLTEL